MYLIVYKCNDNGEAEACFVESNFEKAIEYIKTAKPPTGFEKRDGYFFLEDCNPDYDSHSTY